VVQPLPASPWASAMPTLRPPAGFGILPELRGSPLPAAPIFRRDQFTENFISLIASESLTQPPTRRVA
jgi:hypothetical protein